MNTIPFADLKTQYLNIREEVLAAIDSVCQSTQFVLGPEVASFEQEFANFCGAAFGVAVNSGTSALHLALLAAGAGPGDEVITVPWTFVATVAAIGYTGARPVLVDVDPVTYTMDTSALESLVTNRTRAIVPVHLYGQPADMDAIWAVARRYGLAVIEDAAQAHAAEYHGRRCGSLGDMGCFSFYPGKNLGAYGEGGLITTNDAETARRLRMLRDWGAERKYEHVLKGYNYRMEGIQGAVLRVKLRHLEQWTHARRQHASAYKALLSNAGLHLPQEAPETRHAYHVYAVMTENRDQLAKALKSDGIQTGIHYPYPIHLLPAYSDLGYGLGDFPVAERLAAQELSLPMFPEMSLEQISAVVDAIHRSTSMLQAGASA